MERNSPCLLGVSGEDKVSTMNGRKTCLTRTWNEFINRDYYYLRKKNMNNEYCENCISQMQNPFKHHQLSSYSSEPLNCSHTFNSKRSNPSESSDDSNMSNVLDTSASSFTVEEDDDDADSQDGSIVFTDSEESTMQTKKKAVSFELTPVVHTIRAWDYAYRAARIGPWEQCARDRERFKGRIKSIALVLDPILKSTHRSRVWQDRFVFSE
ncbi:hypothetical protein PUN28_020099 [Cardiocondyla obscurior]